MTGFSDYPAAEDYKVDDDGYLTIFGFVDGACFAKTRVSRLVPITGQRTMVELKCGSAFWLDKSLAEVQDMIGRDMGVPVTLGLKGVANEPKYDPCVKTVPDQGGRDLRKWCVEIAMRSLGGSPNLMGSTTPPPMQAVIERAKAIEVYVTGKASE